MRLKVQLKKKEEASQNTIQGLKAQLKKEEELKSEEEEAFNLGIHLANMVPKGMYWESKTILAN